MIPEQFIQELLSRVDIVDVVDKSVPLKKAGANYSACCPFHNEKSPSFTVSPTKQFYHCFGCGAHGTAVGFLMEYAGLSFVEAIHELAKQVGMIVPQETRDPDRPSQKEVVGLQESLQQAAQYFKTELKKSSRAIDYLKGRGLSGLVAAKFQVGYAPAGWQNLQAIFPDYENEALTVAGLVVTNDQGKRYDRFRDRIMFPIHNQKGEVIGFGGRVINPEDTPKYYNSPETPLFQKGHELYGLFVARRAIREAQRVLVVEGYMDVVALSQYGIDYAVAALGTATTPFHIQKLMRQTDNIIFCFDGDNAGRTAAWRAAMNALPAITDKLKLSFLFLPAEHDPDSYVRAYGKEKFETEMQTAMPLSQYLIHYLIADNGLNADEDSGRFWNEVKPILTQINQQNAPILFDKLRKKVADLVGMSLPAIMKLMDFKEQKKEPQKKMSQAHRSTMSIKKNFLCHLIMHLDLALPTDMDFADTKTLEDALIREVAKLAAVHPQYKAASVLAYLKSLFDTDYIEQLTLEISLLDEKIEKEVVIEGFRTQLREQLMQKQKANIVAELQQKPFHLLTDEDREQLKKITQRR